MSKTLPIAVQVYSVREEAERDFAGTMKKLGEMGYDGVELAGLYGKSAEEIRDSIKAAGLTAISAHVSYDELAGDLEKTLQDYETIGCRYIVIPWLGEDRRFGAALYEETIKGIPVISEGCKKHGMTLLYHNHDFEFAKTPDGTYALDQLYAEVPADVLGAEPDTCWIKVGGPDPSEWLKKYSGRCPLVHVKDFRRKADGVDLLALGEGEQDFPTLVKTAKECGAQWLVIEQDDHPYGTPMGDMKKSLNYLKELGKESAMTKIIKAGVVGSGGIANGKHFPAIKKNGKIELVAFCDLIKERAEKAKEEYGTPDARVYTDYTELVKEDVDVVYVLTPNNAHAPVSIAAMKAGKHVMCEKPMAKTYAEAKEMVKTAKETGKILTIGYQNRYRADSQYLKSACEADELGEIYYAKAHGVETEAAYSDKNTDVASKALYVAHSLLDREWQLGRDDIGLSITETNGSMVRLFEQEVWVPSNYNGTMPGTQGTIKQGVKFLDFRQDYLKNEKVQEFKEAYDEAVANGTDKTEAMESVELNYHRFWHAGDILLALGTMYELYPDMEPDKYDTEPDPDPDALDVEEKDITVEVGDTATIKPNKDGCSFESSDPSIAEVDENGVVTGIAAGETTVIVSKGDETVTVNVTVVESSTGDTVDTSEIPEGTHWGDVNVDSYVNIADVVALNMYLIGPDVNPVTKQGLINANVAYDDYVNTTDGLTLMNYVAMVIEYEQLGPQN